MTVPAERVPRRGAVRARGRGRVPAEPADGGPVGRHPRRPGTSRRWRSPTGPIVVIRGDDGVARTFLNACRHRGRSVAEDCFGHGRRMTCPYHSWVYDTAGKLVGIPGKEAFDGLDVEGLSSTRRPNGPAPCSRSLTVGAELDIDGWLGDMQSALEMLQLDKLHRYDVETKLPSGNWKATADGYLDGYHLGYLHRNIDRRQVDHQPQHVRPVRPARPHRLRQQADPRASRRPAGGVGRQLRLLLARPLRLPQHLDLRPSGSTR